MLTLEHIAYSYHKGIHALNDINATIDPGIHILMGENGAGKTTLLHLLAGLLTPTEGTAALDETDLADRTPVSLQRRFILDENAFFPGRSINTFARMHSRFYPTFNTEKFQRNLEAFGMTGNEAFTRLSLGQSKKARLAYALSLGVDLLLLDEPTNGLDIDSKVVLRQLIAESIDDGQYIIVSTHTVSELDRLYDGVIILDHGHLVLNDNAWHIAEKIAFVHSTLPAKHPLYEEQEIGLFHSIVTNPGGKIESKVDFRLLYSALRSPARNNILQLITSEK